MMSIRLAGAAVLALILVVAVEAGWPADRQAGRSPDTAQPQRIISLVPAVTEMLFVMGAGRQVVAVSNYDRYPPEAASLPRVGALVDPDVERILSLRPDLVVVYATQDDLMQQLERVRIPMFNYQHAGVADITQTMRRLGARVGRSAEAEAASVVLEASFADTRRRVAGLPKPRTALLFGREAGSLRGLFASGGVGFMHDMLVIAGGDDVFADIGRQSIQISTETILARAPDVIVEVYPGDGWTPERIASERAVWRVLSSVPAVRDGRIHILADERFIVPGPRVGEAARLLARTLHPVAFRAP
jgi:iron complex transport system substrate-binding protein